MKKLFLLALPLLAITFNSCSKDDDGGDDGYQWPTYGKLVKKVAWHSDTNDYNDDCEFTYDNQQRLVKATWDNGYSKSLTYNNNTITLNDNGEFYTTYILDENGYLTRQNDDDGSYAVHEYSSGYSSKSTEIKLDKDSDYDKYEEIYTWLNGNLVKQVGRYYDGTKLLDYTFTYNYTYNSIENKLNLNILDIFDFSYWEPTCINFRGRSLKNYPISQTNDDGETLSYSYTFDNDGYPTKIVETWADGHGYTSSSTTTITYY